MVLFQLNFILKLQLGMGRNLCVSFLWKKEMRCNDGRYNDMYIAIWFKSIFYLNVLVICSTT